MSNFIDFFNRLLGLRVNVPSPGDWMPEYSTQWTSFDLAFDLRQLWVKLDNPPKVYLCPVAITGSMDNVMDFGNTAILIAGSTPADHQKLIDHLIVGDIIVYESAPAKGIMHRIVEIKDTTQGKQYVMRGDNNAYTDSKEVHAADVQWVCIGVLY